MASCQLKIYRGPSECRPHTISKTDAGESRITVSLGEVLPLLADAVNSRRTWLDDFDDDDITMPTDLFEVLKAYQYYRRPSA